MTEAGLGARPPLVGDISGDPLPRPVLVRFVVACALLLPLVLAISWSVSEAPAGILLGAVAFILMVLVTGRSLVRSYPHARLGIGNLVTLSRTGIIAALFGPLAVPGLLGSDAWAAWTVLGIAIFSLCLDGVDGYFARRQQLVSAFGARFDMEVDSVFALLLAVLALQSGKAEAWVLILGSMRYLFLLAALILPWLHNPLPERFSRKLICVIQIGVLIALLAPIISGPLSWALAAIATALLVYSFGRDIVWLARQRR
jgi:phosphatidylglycerophosphate synthase